MERAKTAAGRAGRASLLAPHYCTVHVSNGLEVLGLVMLSPYYSWQRCIPLGVFEF